ncbi:MAG: hypothetical protein U1C58_10935 [Flavobacteriaceae bacterium]|nr:hypothetical protein [Flavobacteriaceae bacterium]
MKLNILYFFLAFVFLFESCISNDKKKSIELKVSESNFKIVDSIVIKEPNIFLKAKQADKLLFIRTSNQDIILYDLKNKKLSKINVFGDGPEKVSMPLGYNIGFLSDSLIWVSNINAVLKYNFAGKFQGKYAVINENTYAPLLNVTLKDSTLIALTFPQGYTNKLSFYENKQTLFLKHDLKNNEQIRFFDFPTEGSNVYTDDYFLGNNHYFHVNYTETKEEATFLSAVEPLLFTLDFQKCEISKKITFSPEYFAPLKVYFKDKPDNTMIFMQAYMGSVFNGHFIVNERNYVFYSIPYSLEYMTEFVKTHKNFPFEQAPEIKFALTVFDNEGKKLRDDIVFPTSLGKALLMDEEGIIYFMKNPTEEDEKKGQTVYYKVRLTDEKP